MLQAKHEACVQIPAESLSEYDRILYLALRRGLLLVAAQLAWLAEARAYFESEGGGMLGPPGRKAKKKPGRVAARKRTTARRR
jgi:hypothetical protein